MYLTRGYGCFLFLSPAEFRGGCGPTILPIVNSEGSTADWITGAIHLHVRLGAKIGMAELHSPLYTPFSRVGNSCVIIRIICDSGIRQSGVKS